MPIYEYRCDACGHELEALQKLNDAPLTDCPECSAGDLRRLISKPSFRLKGGGWYETDFKSDKETKRNLVSAKDEPSKPKSKKDDKPAKSDAKSTDSGSKSSSKKKDSGNAAA